MDFRRYRITLYNDFIHEVKEPINTPKKDTIEYKLQKARHNKNIMFIAIQTWVCKKDRYFRTSNDKYEKDDFEKSIVYLNLRDIACVELIPQFKSNTEE